MADSTNIGDRASPRRRIDMSIASATGISSAIDTHGYYLAGIDWSSGTTANRPLTFSVSQDGSTFLDLYDSTGGQVQVSSGAFSTSEARAVAFDNTLINQLAVHRYVKVRTGLSSSPASNGATAHLYSAILLPL